MDNSLYVGLSRQETLQRALDVVANNIANADTAGFKVESPMVQTEPATPPGSAPDTRPVAYVLDHGIVRDFSEGALNTTGNPYDVAIEGQGFFQVQTAAGLRYTRDGQFTVNTQGQLVTKDGDAVLDNSGRPITLDPKQPVPAIADDGTVSQGTTSVGRIGVYRFTDQSVLQKDGGNLYEAPATATPTAANDALVHQGTVEGSNVKPVLEISHLIEITRAYERIAQIMSQTNDMSDQAVDRLGKAA